MANRTFNRKQALEKQVCEIYAKVSIGSSGAPTLVDRTGIASIVRNSAGTYTLTLQDRYVSLKSAQIEFMNATAQDLQAQLLAETVNSSTPAIQFVCLTAATATDPSSATTVLIKLDLKNTSAV